MHDHTMPTLLIFSNLRFVTDLYFHLEDVYEFITKRSKKETR
jgi:hypothetical protein